MIAIIDYVVGNLYSLKSSFAAIGEEAVVTNEKSVIDSADGIILPGVGAFCDAMKKLETSGMAEVLKEQAQKGKKIMGICLGMQLLFEKSYEYGEYDGLGLINGEIKPIYDYLSDKELKIPHIGWNALKINENNCPIFKYLKDGDYVYFVHSYFAECPKEYVAATTDYSVELTAAVAKDNIYGCQFHPEKSGDVGLSILKAFCEI